MPDAVTVPKKHLFPKLKGRLESFEYKSEILNADRKAKIFLPGEGKSIQKLLIVFDGGCYIHLIPVPQMIESLSAEKEDLNHTAALFLEHEDRNIDLLCNADFAQMVLEELVPYACQNFNIPDTVKLIPAGSSYGGLAAVFFAYLYPEKISAVIAQSPSISYVDEEENRFIDQFCSSKNVHKNCSWYVSVGFCETSKFKRDRATERVSIMEEATMLRDALQEKNLNVSFELAPGGHDYPAWGVDFYNILKWL